jgi:RimJ/RimL family protein N-acetyltransferase
MDHGQSGCRAIRRPGIRLTRGGAFNGEVKRLMIAHAFGFARTVWFHVSPGNVRSQRALERIGARLDRREMVPVGGVPSERMIYRVDRR